MSLLSILKESTTTHHMNVDELIELIKRSLLDYYDYETWKEFIDNQNMGDCQLIVSSIMHDFKHIQGLKKVFGEIRVDHPKKYMERDWDDYESEEEIEKENDLFTHHWVEYKGEVLEFSKGTLQNYIDWDDLYTTDPEDKTRYE